jgi:type IV pilus assembly protein PilW
MSPRTLPARMKGLTLIELMISMTIGLATIAAVGWVYLGTMQTYRTHDALSRLQEGARHTFEVIAKDLRMTGVTGCSWATNMNVVKNADTTWYASLFTQPLISVEQNGAGETEFSDALRVLHADVSKEYIVANHNTGTSTIELTADHDIGDGQLLIATDCVHVSVFQASAAAGKTVTHLAGTGPGNDATQLGSPLGSAYTYGPGSRLYKLHAATYYVDENPAGVPSLYRLSPSGAGGVLEAEELVEGVEDLRVTYGVDTSSPPDGETDTLVGVPYLTATEVTNAVALGPAADRWNRVVSIRISLLMRTIEDRVVPETQLYSYNGAANIDPGDRRLRKVFTHVIKLRNR